MSENHRRNMDHSEAFRTNEAKTPSIDAQPQDEERRGESDESPFLETEEEGEIDREDGNGAVFLLRPKRETMARNALGPQEAPIAEPYINSETFRTVARKEMGARGWRLFDVGDLVTSGDSGMGHFDKFTWGRNTWRQRQEMRKFICDGKRKGGTTFTMGCLTDGNLLGDYDISNQAIDTGPEMEKNRKPPDRQERNTRRLLIHGRPIIQPQPLQRHGSLIMRVLICSTRSTNG